MVNSVSNLRKKLQQKSEWEQDNIIYVMLDNYYLTCDYPLENKIRWFEHIFSSVEAAYKFHKYSNTLEFIPANEQFQSFCIVEGKTAEDIRAKERELASDLRVNEEWDDVKYSIMYNAHKAKFEANPDLAKKLLDTGNKQIIAPSFPVDSSGNPWGDTYWEMSFGEDLTQVGGQNKIGEILMQIRNQIRST